MKSAAQSPNEGQSSSKPSSQEPAAPVPGDGEGPASDSPLHRMGAAEAVRDFQPDALEECDFERFRQLSLDDKRDVFKRCRPDQQVELYLRWTTHTRPMNLELAAVFASRGKQVLPAVLSRMERSGGLGEDTDRRMLLDGLRWMHSLGAYNITKDKESISRMRSALDLSSTPRAKKLSQDALDRLIHPKRRFRKSKVIEDDQLDIVAIPAGKNLGKESLSRDRPPEPKNDGRKPTRVY